MKTVSKIVSTLVLVTVSGSAFAQATVFRGTHIGFTTASATAGQQLELRTGYGTSGAPESEQWAYRFASVAPGVQQLQTRSTRHATDPNAPFAQSSFNLWHSAPTNWRAAENGGGLSPVNGWYAQSSMSALHPVTERQTFNPTGGDAFVATGNIVGGSYAYEILSVNPIAGSPLASFAIGMLVNPAGNTDNSLRQLQGTNTVGTDSFDVLGIYDQTQASGGALGDRSIFLGNGNHFHGWGFFISERGLYEVSMRVYDTTGTYASSDIFNFQINSVPTPGVLAMLSVAGLAATRRRRA